MTQVCCSTQSLPSPIEPRAIPPTTTLAPSFLQCCLTKWGRSRPDKAKQRTQTGLSGTWHSWSTPSTLKRKGSETSSDTTAAGWKIRDRKTLMDGRCGLLEVFWLDQQILD